MWHCPLRNLCYLEAKNGTDLFPKMNLSPFSLTPAPLIKDPMSSHSAPMDNSLVVALIIKSFWNIRPDWLAQQCIQIVENIPEKIGEIHEVHT